MLEYFQVSEEIITLGLSLCLSSARVGDKTDFCQMCSDSCLGRSSGLQ